MRCLLALVLASLLAGRAGAAQIPEQAVEGAMQAAKATPIPAQVLESEDRELQVAASMRLIKDPEDQGVYAVWVELKNTSPNHEFLFTINGGHRVKGQEDGTSYFIWIFKSGNNLSDGAFVIKCFPSPTPRTAKIPPLGSYDWLIPLNQHMKEPWPPDRVVTGCYLFVNISLAYTHQKLATLDLRDDQPQTGLIGELVSDHWDKSLKLHASDVTLTGKALAGDAEKKFEQSQKGK